MPNLLDMLDIGVRESGNAGPSVITIPRDMRKTIFLTEEYDNLNEDYSYTRTGNYRFRDIVISDDVDLAPAMSLRAAAEAARSLIAGLPNDIIDADLGPDL